MACIENDKFGWRYYNHAMLPTCAPHETPNLDPVNDNTIWTHSIPDGGYPLLARWTTDYDCGYETKWWYCIMDTPFDIDTINSKKRYEINKGKRNFEVLVINPIEYRTELYECSLAAYNSWPNSYRPSVDKKSFFESVNTWSRDENVVVLGAFKRENNGLMGYALLQYYPKYIKFSMLRVYPECEKYAINAALVAGICELSNKKIESGFYIVDGERSILHETNFQEYLVKYFRIRKAYCKLNVKYNKIIRTIVNILYPFRGIVFKLSTFKLWQKVGAILIMEEFVREKR